MPLLINCHPVFMYLLLFSVQHNITKTPIQFSSFRSSPEYELMSFIQEEPVNTITKGQHTRPNMKHLIKPISEKQKKKRFCVCVHYNTHTLMAYPFPHRAHIKHSNVSVIVNFITFPGNTLLRRMHHTLSTHSEKNSFRFLLCFAVYFPPPTFSRCIFGDR